MNETTRKTLELFVEKTDELYEYIAAGNRLGGLMGVYSNTDGKTWKLHKEVNGFVVTFRWFIQSERDDTLDIALYASHRNGLAKTPRLFSLTDVSNEWSAAVTSAWAAGNNFLDLNLSDIETPMTRRKVVDVFIYGNIVHATQRDTFKDWQKDPEQFGRLSLHFTSTLAFMFFEWIRPVADACKKELAR